MANQMAVKPVSAAPTTSQNKEFNAEEFFADKSKDAFYNETTAQIYKDIGVNPPPPFSDPSFEKWAEEFKAHYRVYQMKKSSFISMMWANRETLRREAMPFYETRVVLSGELDKLELGQSAMALIGVDFVSMRVDALTSLLERKPNEQFERNSRALSEVSDEFGEREEVVENDLDQLTDYFADLRVEEERDSEAE